jgi:CRP-like cAMP-binding protein
MISQTDCAGSVKYQNGDRFTPAKQENTCRWNGSHDNGRLHHFAAGDIIYWEGDAKIRVYSVVSGAVALFQGQGEAVAVDLVFPGQFLGLGCLRNHAFTARAMRPTTAQVRSDQSLRESIERDPFLKAQDDDATKREFIARRNSLTAKNPASPLRRLAAFIVALSELNSREGHDPYIIHGPFLCQAIADFTAMDLDTLAAQLIELRRRRLINDWEPDGLVLLDFPGLESVANDSSVDPCVGFEVSEETGTNYALSPLLETTTS